MLRSMAFKCPHTDQFSYARGICAECFHEWRQRPEFDEKYPRLRKPDADRTALAYIDLTEMGMSKREIARSLGIQVDSLTQAVRRYNKRMNVY